MEKKHPRRKLWLALWCLFLVVVVIINVTVTNVALYWDKALTGYFGSIGGSTTAKREVTAVTDDASKYDDLDSLLAAEKEAELQIVEEGMVLLKNDNNVLPLAKGSKVSVFGQTAQMWLTKEKLTNTKDTVFLESLQDAGLEINGTLRKFYKQSKHTKWGNGANLGNGGIPGAWAVDEVPVSEYKDSVKDSFAEYNDAAIVVFSRGGSEGGDLPRSMDRFGGETAQGYLELSKEEKDLLQMVSESFDKIIVVMHTTNALQMDFDTEAYGIDAIVWISGTGEDGVSVVGKLFTGDINPSGRTVDTFVYDNLSAPAMQNFGDFRFTADGKLIDATTTTVGGTYSYQNYAESIYVGYKYYETRYEDRVMGTGNAGSYDYAQTVAYPFGYGLSYTTFAWDHFTASPADSDGNITLSVQVTNTGSVAGKDVVQLYYQSPYTDYDRTNGVEKASANLLDFGKTNLLAPGESETISLTVNLYDMVSYDENAAKTYILDAGDYYLTLARDAHQAVNNFLAAKGYRAKDGMTGDGDASFVATHHVAELTKRATSSTGYQITNIFDDCQLPDAVYLSRQDWSVMDNNGLRYADGTMDGVSQTTNQAGTVYTHEATQAIITALTTEGWDRAGNPRSMTDESWGRTSYEEKNGLVLSDMTGLAHDDAQWEKLLNQMSQAEQVEMIGRAMYTTSAVPSIGKSVAWSLDGPQGMIDYISGGSGYQFTDENLLAATWSKELNYLMADLCTQEFKLKGVTTWWSPAINIHRTAYSGRNFEYFSEDGVFSGLMGQQWVLAARSNGINCQIKHFFMNDQETNRGANGRLAVYSTEQAMREIYAKPFQMCIEGTNAAGVMLSMARVGSTIAPGSYAVCTELLRNEWGMKGAVITDAQSLTPYEAEQALAAGCDMVCSTAATEYLPATLASVGGQAMLRSAVKHTLYMEANSAAVEVTRESGFPIYIIILIAYHVLTVIYMAYLTIEIIRKLWPEKKLLDKAIRPIRAVLWTVAAIGLIFLLVMFFTTWLPKLRYALQTAV